MGLCSACYSNVQYIQRLEGTWEEKFSIRFLIMKCQNRELPIYHIHIHSIHNNPMMHEYENKNYRCTTKHFSL